MMSKYFSNQRIQLLLVMSIAVASSFLFLGARGLYETTEGRYGECAREMLTEHSILTPVLHGEPHLTKPPLAYWSMIAGMKLLGQNGWGVRLFLAVSFCITTLALYLLAAAMWDHRTGLVAALVYATSPFPLFSASVLSTDTLLVLWEVAAVLCFVKWHVSAQRNSQWLLLMWIMLGLGFLTKGPPTLLPLLPIIVWMLLRKESPAPLFNPLSLAAFAVLSFGWYAVMCLQNPGLFDYLINREIIGRLADTSRNPQWYKPFMLYLPPLIFGAGIWLFYPLASLGKLHKSSYDIADLVKRPGYASLIVFWAVLPVTLLFFVKSRLTLYVLPFYPAVAMMIALMITRLRQTSFRRLLVPALTTAAIVIALKGLAALCPQQVPGLPISKDMKILYQECKEVDNDADEVVLFEQPHFEGLEFYFNGKLTRARTSATADNADCTITNYLDQLLTAKVGKMPLFVSTPKDAATLADLLAACELAFTSHDAGKWIIFRITPFDSSK